MAILIRIFALLAFVVGMTLADRATYAQNPLERLLMPGDLIQGHAKLEKECSNCHRPFEKAAQSQLCLNCHKEIASDIDTNEGLHGRSKAVDSKQCKQCHTDHKGRDADIVQLDRQTFDHQLTDFPLEGRHAGLACEQCHKAGKKFRETSAKCVDCHRSVSPHKDQTGDQCDTCHAAADWRSLRAFDHSKTKFALTGAHQQAACTSCHRNDQFKNLPVACITCHRAQDKHAGRNGPKCEGCHTTASWRDVKFDHDKDTKFPLIGHHASVACAKCHTSDPRKVKLKTSCISCHAKEDKEAHHGQLGPDCIKCHNESGWKVGVLFDHNATRFPLAGKHAGAECSKCHKSKAYRDAPVACVGCHQTKDVHKATLGLDCAKCHVPVDWKRWTFDHDRQTNFALTGRHRGLTCAACHTKPAARKVTASTACVSCHRKDDRHRGAFGSDCGRCHKTDTFARAFIRR